MKNVATNINTSVNGLDKVKSLNHYRNLFKTDTNSSINVHANPSSVATLKEKLNDTEGVAKNLKARLTKVNSTLSNNTSAKRGLVGLKDKANGLTSALGRAGEAGRNSLGHIGTGADRAKNQMHRLRSSGSRLKSTFAGVFSASILSNALSSAKNGVEGVVKSGYHLIMVGKGAEIAWSHIGLNKAQDKAMTEQMENIREMSDMDDNSIMHMQRSFYTLTDSAPKARNLVSEVVDFGKASGENNREINRMGQTLPRVLATSKIRASMFQRTFRESPKLMKAIIQNSGMGQQAFNKLLSSGKLTSKQLQLYMQRASKGSSQAWAEYTGTFGGKVAYMERIWNGAKAKFSRPFTNTLVTSVSQLAKSPKQLKRTRSAVNGVAGSLGQRVGNVMGKAINFLVKNRRPLLRIGSALFRIIATIGKGVWSTFASTLNGITGHSHKASGGLIGVSNSLTRISKHTSGLRRFGKLIFWAFAYSKIYKFSHGIVSVGLGIFKLVKTIRVATTASTGLNAAMDANPVGVVTVAVAGLVAGLVALYTHFKWARVAMNAVGRALKFTLLLPFKLLGWWIKGTTHSFISFISFLKHKFLFFRKLASGAKRVFSTMGSGAKKIAHGIGSKFSSAYHKVTGSSNKANRRISRNRKHSSHNLVRYLGRNGKVYRRYHKGTERMNNRSLRSLSRARSRYARKESLELRHYEKHYKRYQAKRSSLSRKYGKLRAMYSLKSLKDIEKRFRNLKNVVDKYAHSMYRSTRKWFRKMGQVRYISNQTRNLTKLWKRQRSSLITHNERMTKAERTHFGTITSHLKTFSKRFKSLMSDLETKIYSGWSKMWTHIYDRAGNGMNKVQNPLNAGASHLNGFVKAFGETSSPIHQMPSISYATGTGLHRPITQLTNAILNDGNDPKGNQETVISPHGQMSFPNGRNTHEILPAGSEVLNSHETRLMKALSDPTVHFASGTGFFSKIGNWIKHLFTGGSPSNNTISQTTLFNDAKGKGNHRLLNEMQNVLKSPAKILSGMFGKMANIKSSMIRAVAKGIVGFSNKQTNSWWITLMGLINQELDNDGSSSNKALNYAEKISKDKPYVWGGMSSSGYDCSGLVYAMLKHFGITPNGRTSGAEIDSFPHISRSQARAGDLVGNGSHIGIVSDNGARHYYSAFDYKNGIQNFPLDQDHWTAEDHSMKFARVPKLTKMGSQAPKLKSDSALSGFIKNQERPMLNWINKKLVPLLDVNPAGIGVKRWIPIIKHAAEMTHSRLTPRLMNLLEGTIQNESGGNSTISNNYDSNAKAGNASVGLLQYTPTTFGSYAFPGHHNIRKGLDQMLAFFNSSNYQNALVDHDTANGKNGGEWSPAHGSGPSGSKRFARGGNFHANEPMIVGEHGIEAIKPNFSGSVIPHQETKQAIDKSQRPVNVKQNVTINVNNANGNGIKKINSTMSENGDKLAKKLSDLLGFNDNGGYVI